MENTRLKILKVLSENPQKGMKASEIKLRVENMETEEKVNARDYGNILRSLRRDGLLKTDAKAYPLKWTITEKGLRSLGKRAGSPQKPDHDEGGNETRLVLYERGLSDKEIAEKMEVSRSAVQAWRSRRNLPPNPADMKKKIGRSLENEIKPYLIQELENRAHPDPERVVSEILESLDESMESGKAWRKAKELLNKESARVGPEDLIGEVKEEMEVREEIIEKANQIISEYREVEKISGSRSGVAGGSIYLASLLFGKRLTQKKVASAFDITPSTVRNHFHKMAESLGIDYTYTTSGLPKVRGRKQGDEEGIIP